MSNKFSPIVCKFENAHRILMINFSLHLTIMIINFCSLDHKRSKEHIPWRMAERARSRHSNTDLAHNNLHYHYYTRSEDQQDQRQQHTSKHVKENSSKKHHNDFDLVVEDYSDDENAPQCDVIVEEENKMVSRRNQRSSYSKSKHNKHFSVTSASALPNKTMTLQQHQHDYMVDPMQRQENELQAGIPESSRSKNKTRLFSDQHYQKVKIRKTTLV